MYSITQFQQSASTFFVDVTTTKKLWYEKNKISHLKNRSIFPKKGRGLIRWPRQRRKCRILVKCQSKIGGAGPVPGLLPIRGEPLEHPKLPAAGRCRTLGQRAPHQKALPGTIRGRWGRTVRSFVPSSSLYTTRPAPSPSAQAQTGPSSVSPANRPPPDRAQHPA